MAKHIQAEGGKLTQELLCWPKDGNEEDDAEKKPAARPVKSGSENPGASSPTSNLPERQNTLHSAKNSLMNRNVAIASSLSDRWACLPIEERNRESANSGENTNLSNYQNLRQRMHTSTAASLPQGLLEQWINSQPALAQQNQDHLQIEQQSLQYLNQRLSENIADTFSTRQRLQSPALQQHQQLQQQPQPQQHQQQERQGQWQQTELQQLYQHLQQMRPLASSPQSNPTLPDTFPNSSALHQLLFQQSHVPSQPYNDPYRNLLLGDLLFLLSRLSEQQEQQEREPQHQQEHEHQG